MIWTLLRDQRGQFWGGVFSGLGRSVNEGLERNERTKRERERLEMEKKRADMEFKRFDLQERMLKRQEEEQLREMGALEKLAIDFERGQPGQMANVPITMPEQAPQFGGMQEQPGLREKLIGAGTPSVGGDPQKAGMIRAFGKAALPHVLPKQATPPTTLEGVAVQRLTGGDQAGAESAMRLREVGKAGAKQPLSAEQLSSIYGMDPQQAQRLAALPAEAQEKTIDNLRAQANAAATDRRHETSQQNLFSRLEMGEQRRRAEQEKRDEMRRVPPLTPKERSDLLALNEARNDLTELNRLMSESKGKFTGMIQGGPMRTLKEKTDLIGKEQSDFNARLARVVNAIRNKRFGAALTQYESTEALKELPDTSQGDKTVKAKLAQLQEVFNQAAKDLQSREDYWRGGANPPPPGWR